MRDSEFEVFIRDSMNKGNAEVRHVLIKAHDNIYAAQMIARSLFGAGHDSNPETVLEIARLIAGEFELAQRIRGQGVADATGM